MTSQFIKPHLNTEQTADSSRNECAARQAKRFHSIELFGQTREVLIEHGGCVYRLSITQANKLILTK
jgi:hemin uptake protein HemP